ncbi:MAG: M15 family metallopeptidase [Planctomycetota bacterium]
MTLRRKQSVFAKNVGKLIAWAYKHGYELTFGETYRTPAQARLNAARGIGIVKSLHCSRLAIDLNLFINDSYTTTSEAHEPLGKYWKTLHPLNRWGGDFRRRDGNHYSMTHGGRA